MFDCLKLVEKKVATCNLLVLGCLECGEFGNGRILQLKEKEHMKK